MRFCGCTVGLVFAGSAVYMMGTSTSVIWSALISCVVFNRHLSWSKFASIWLVVFGLGMRAFRIRLEWHDHEFLGIILIAVAAVLHGGSYVYNEKFMNGSDAIEGPNLVCMTGIISSVLLTIWTMVWTVPQYESLFLEPIARQGGSLTIVVLCWAALLVCAIIRSATLWFLLKNAGAVTTGMLKGIRAAIVFVCSHFFFCHLQESQCLSPLKATSAIVCVAGVLLYSVWDAVWESSLSYKVDESNLPSYPGDSTPDRKHSDVMVDLLVTEEVSDLRKTT
eukprot:GHVT01012050.1.p1 GENE.GHVT01012050.1~~GHVT01012050.1.p1  ORF type:complete len:279 (+),score=-4.19 GHVT01012050.1:202-1038(+)